MVEPTLEHAAELMKQVDVILATGGVAMVKVAYSSGTPAFGVGASNAVITVDETADLDDSASKIQASKTFDLATSCSADNAVIGFEAIADELLEKLSVVMAFYRVKNLKQAIELTHRIQEYSDYGHSCGLYSSSDANILEFALPKILPNDEELFGAVMAKTAAS